MSWWKPIFGGVFFRSRQSDALPTTPRPAPPERIERPLIGRVGTAVRAIEDRAGDVEAALAACTPFELARLDGIVRSRMTFYGEPLIRATSESLPELHRLGVASFDGNGRARETAVRRLDARDDPRVLPFLLIRLTDWVPVVRTLAADAVRRRLNAEHAGVLVTCLPLLEQLGNSGRRESVDLAAAARTMLLAPAYRTLLRDVVGSAAPADARLAYALLLEGDPADLPDVLADVLDADRRRTDDTAIRLMAARRVREASDRGDLREMLQPLRDDRFMPVRREWLYAKVNDEAALRTMLFDPHVSIREAARFYLRERGIDFAAIYRERLGVEPSAAAVAGLGETGGAADAKRVAQLSGADTLTVRTRAAAIRAVARLDADGYSDLLHTALNDPASSVGRAAFESLLARPTLIDAAKLWPAVATPCLAVAARRALTLIATQVWWDAAPWLIRATGVPDARDAALDHLQTRRSKGGRVPAWATAAQLDAFRASIAAHRETLDAASLADIDRLLAEANR